MTPATWITLWATLIAVAGIGFAMLAIVVAVRGVQDIRSMLRRMKSEDANAAARH